MSACSRRNRAGGLPETSNCYCHPGKAGGSPLDFSLKIDVDNPFARVVARNKASRLCEQLGRLFVAALGQRHVALGRGRARRAEHLHVFGRLRLLIELARLLRRGDLRLGRLWQELMRAR